MRRLIYIAVLLMLIVGDGYGQSQVTYTWQHGAAFGKDTYLDKSQSNFNYGITNVTKIRGSAGATHRTITEFDSIQYIPSTSTIDSAFLSYTIAAFNDAQAGDSLAIYRITRAWDEGTKNGAAGNASWDSSANSIEWTAAGGDFNATQIGTPVQISGLNAGDTLTYNVTSLVQDWFDGTSDNYGFMAKLQNDASGSNFNLHSSDAATGTDRPKLVVYTTTAASTPTGDIITGSRGNVIYDPFAISADKQKFKYISKVRKRE